MAELVDTDAGTLLRMRVSSLEWMAGVLAGLECSFSVREPPELRESVRQLAARLHESAAALPAG
jgi:predicted DNA-binding transcriptional regulator YafY